jgi:MFS family permease
LFAASVIARLPLGMVCIALLMHAKHLTGSFAAAGLVDGAYAVAAAVGAPLLGQLVDRRGQTRILLGSATAAAILLAVLAALPQRTERSGSSPSRWLLGLTMPPVGAFLRALLSDLPLDAEGAASAYALRATTVELTWISRPAIAVAIGTTVSTAAALAAAEVILLAGTLSFAAHPASRRWRPGPTPGPRSPRSTTAARPSPCASC